MDLALSVLHPRGQNVSIRNCWHFFSDGSAVEVLFYDDADFIMGMNRLYVLDKKYQVLILGCVLMDTHIHLALWGEFYECQAFVKDYVKRLSIHLSKRYGMKHTLENLPVRHQEVEDDAYLKTLISYIIKNPPVAGLPYNFYDYPWGSGPLYFRKAGLWASPEWMSSMRHRNLSYREKKALLKAPELVLDDVRMMGDLVFPGEYVAYELVEKLFRSIKAFNYFICRTKESDVDEREGVSSWLSLPYAEMLQIKRELCNELFGVRSTRTLDVHQRIRLAKVMRFRYNCSPKQVARMAGLVYSEVKDIFR